MDDALEATLVVEHNQGADFIFLHDAHGSRGYMLLGPATLFFLLAAIYIAVSTMEKEARRMFIALAVFSILYSLAVTLVDENEPIRHTMQMRVIVNTMLGHPPGNTPGEYGELEFNRLVNEAKANFPEWETRVRYYDSVGNVDYNRSTQYGVGGVTNAGSPFYWNSVYYYTSSGTTRGIKTTNNGRHQDNDFYRRSTVETQKSIVFYDLIPGGGRGPVSAYIKQNCGNPMGPVSLRPVPVTSGWEYDINTNVQASVLVGNTFNVSSTISNSSGTDGADAFPSDLYAHRIEITSGSGLVTRTAGGNADDNLTSAAWRWDGAGSGIDNGRQGVHTSTWRANGVGQVCFRSRVWPSEGPAGWYTNALKNSAPVCINIIDNLQFNLGATVTLDQAIASPGEEIGISLKVCNDEPIPVGAIRGQAPNIGITIKDIPI